MHTQAINHGSELWYKVGREFIPSDVKALCEAANEFGIDEIVLNDSHDNGHRTPNVLMNGLPDHVGIMGNENHHRRTLCYRLSPTVHNQTFVVIL